MTIDYDIIVTAFLCVCVGTKKKTLTYNNKLTTISVTSQLQFSVIVQSESHQWQSKMMNVNLVFLHLLKINVKIKSALAPIWKERDINCVWWNLEESCAKIVSCETPLTRRNYFTQLAPIPPDCLRLVSHDTIVVLTRHDWNGIWSNREQSWAKIVSFESALMRACQAGRQFVLFLWWSLVWLDGNVNPRPIAWETDTLTTN